MCMYVTYVRMVTYAWNISHMPSETENRSYTIRVRLSWILFPSKTSILHTYVYNLRIAFVVSLQISGTTAVSSSSSFPSFLSHRFRFNPTYQCCPHNTYPVLADTLAPSETDSELVKSNARDSNDKQCFPISARIKRLPVVPRRRHADDIPFRRCFNTFVRQTILLPLLERKRERTLKQNLNIEMSTYLSDYHIESYRSSFPFNNLNHRLSFHRDRINYINVITYSILFWNITITFGALLLPTNDDLSDLCIWRI